MGVKYNDYKKWEVVYNMIISREHLTDEGRLKIRSLIGKVGASSASILESGT